MTAARDGDDDDDSPAALSTRRTVLPYFPYVSLRAVWNVKKYGVPVDD